MADNVSRGGPAVERILDVLGPVPRIVDPELVQRFGATFQVPTPPEFVRLDRGPTTGGGIEAWLEDRRSVAFAEVLLAGDTWRGWAPAEWRRLLNRWSSRHPVRAQERQDVTYLHLSDVIAVPNSWGRAAAWTGTEAWQFDRVMFGDELALNLSRWGIVLTLAAKVQAQESQWPTAVARAMYRSMRAVSQGCGDYVAMVRHAGDVGAVDAAFDAVERCLCALADADRGIASQAQASALLSGSTEGENLTAFHAIEWCYGHGVTTPVVHDDLHGVLTLVERAVRGCVQPGGLAFGVQALGEEVFDALRLLPGPWNPGALLGAWLIHRRVSAALGVEERVRLAVATALVALSAPEVVISPADLLVEPDDRWLVTSDLPGSSLIDGSPLLRLVDGRDRRDSMPVSSRRIRFIG